MKKLIWILALLTTPAFGQALSYTPPAYAAYLGSAGVWNPWTAASGSGQLGYTPPAIGLYCLSGAQWTPCAPSSSGTGTVTSVAMTGDGVLYNSAVSGSPITTSGTFAPALIAQSANTFFGNCTGSTATPAFCSASTARTALGLGTMATQNVPSNLTITYNSGGTTTFAAASAVFAGGTFTATHSTSTTFSPTNLVTWGSYTAIVKQDSTGGGNTFTLGTGGSCTTWRKPGGGGAVTSLTLSTVANDWDVLAFTYDGTNCILTQGLTTNENSRINHPSRAADAAFDGGEAGCVYGAKCESHGACYCPHSEFQLLRMYLCRRIPNLHICPPK